ncbi:MAG: hypothetical protein LC635_05395 [Pseudonocardiaceae bacterium]|nr:hypothetical protein [Pseudonocardiaceae bacterium]
MSHVLEAHGADRIHLRLKTTFPANETALFSEPGATFVYLLKLGFRYNADDRELVSRTIGVACPGNIVFVPTEDGLRRKIGRFRVAVRDIREAIDKELADRGQPTPDWVTDPPRRREDLPRLLLALRQRKLNERFWHPDDAVTRYLDEAERLCDQFATALTPDMPDGLGEIIPLARETLARIPALREEFSDSPGR